MRILIAEDDYLLCTVLMKVCIRDQIDAELSHSIYQYYLKKLYSEFVQEKIEIES